MQQEKLITEQALEGYRLSPQQAYAWKVRKAGDGAASRAQCAVSIKGELKPEVLKLAAHRVAERHEILRTSFVCLPGMALPLQVINREGAPSWEVLQLVERSLQAQKAEIERLYREAAAVPIDFAQSSPLRFTLLPLSAHHHLLLMSLPVLCADARSLGNLTAEIGRAYAAALQGEEAPDEPVQYVQFSEWQNELLEGGEAEEGRGFWDDQLFPQLTTLSLAFEDVADGEALAFDPVSLRIDPAVSARLQAVVNRLGVSTRVVLLACWQTLLHRLTGESTIVVGCVHEGRKYEPLQDAPGLFARWLPARCQFGRDARFDEVLQQVKQYESEASEWQEYFTWPKVNGGAAEAGLAPAFGFEFVEQHDTQAAAGVRFSVSRQDVCLDRFKVRLSCVQRTDSLVAEFHYDASVLRAEEIERLATQFEVLLAAVVARPGTPVAALEILGEAERRQLLVEWNRTRADYPKGQTLHGLFEEQARRTPDNAALVFEGRRLNYDELDKRANQLARHLREIGVKPESLVGVYMERSVEMVVGLLGILKAGGAYVPLDPDYPRERLSYMLADAGVSVLLTQQPLLASLPTHAVETLCLDSGWEKVARQSEDRLDAEAGPDNLAYIIYTSGSTGRPKGAMLPHRGVVNCLNWMQTTYQLNEADRFLFKTSLNFDPSVWEVFWPLWVGATVVIARPGGQRDSSYLVETIKQHNVTSIYFVPSMLRAFLDEQGHESCDSLKRVICGGEKLAPETLKRFFADLDAELHHSYGPTETSIAATEWTCEADGRWGVIPMGRPLANTQLYVLDLTLRPVPVGVPGELYIGGDGLGRGYLRLTGLTADKFIPDPFGTVPGARLYKTGDQVRYLPDGNVEFLGRIDYQVKIRGYRIELGEIEEVLKEYEGVLEAVLLAREDVPGQLRLCAYLLTQEQLTGAASELRRHAAQRLPDYMVPSAFVLLKSLPLTPGGKVDRQALPTPEEAEPESTYAVPRTPTEELLTGIWARVLNLSQVGVNDNFFQLGGHSLLATQLISRVRQVFQVELTLRTLFAAPTVAELGRCLDDEKGSKSSGAQMPHLERVKHDGPVSLSFAQQRLWFLNQLEPESAFYNMPVGIRLKGALDVQALEESFGKLAERQESLRTSFPLLNGSPSQSISPPAPVSLLLIDLGALPEARREAEMKALAVAEANSPFDLERGPLFRASLLRLGDEDHVLLVTLHHIISDGWSLGVLVSELGMLYADISAGKEPSLPELPVQYSDFASWQREWLQGEALERMLTYWKGLLKDAPPSLDLPTDRPRPAVQTYNGAVHGLTLPPALGGELNELSRQENVTLFMTLLTAFQLLLSRTTGQHDIVVGTPVAGRNRLETESLIGCFINTLVLRADLSGDPTFGELLKKVRDVTLEAYVHQDVPFEKLVEELQPTRDLSRHPLFQVMFILQNAPLPTLQLEGLRLVPLDIENETSKFDLTLSVFEGGDGSLRVNVEYNRDLFDGETIDRMLEHFKILLGGIVADPGRRLSEQPLLGADERRRLIVEWNETLVSYPADECLHELVERQVERTPDAVALVYQDQELTYGELNRRANQLAHFLRELGVGPDVLVGICAERSLEMVIGLLAVLKAGGAYVPLDPSYPAKRLAFMLQDARVAVLLSQEHLVEGLPAHDARLVRLDADWKEVARRGTANPMGGARAENLAYMIYTSGSTGQPKGAMNTHGAIRNRLLWMQDAYHLTDADRVLQKTPFSFDVSVWEFFWPLLAGAQLVVAVPGGHQDGGYLVRLIRERQITVMHFVPAMLRLFVEQEGLELCDSVRKVICSGEALAFELQERFFERSSAELHNLYGPTEAAVDVTFWACERESERRIVPIGRPISNTQIYILDKKLEPTPVGAPGELYIGGEGLARGYLRRAGMTGEKFIPHPFSAEPGARLYRTGDLARFLSDGNVEYLSRTDDQVKVRGFRIELGEIETALAGHPAVREVVVVVRAGSADDKRLASYIVPANSAKPTTGELRSFLKERLPEYMIPSSFTLLESMPLTPNGKVDRKALPQADASRPELESGYVTPQTEAQQSVAAIWQEVLGLEQVGLYDNFFDLGGHSLLLAQVLAKLREVFRQEINMLDLFRHTTVDALTSFLTEEQRGETSTERGRDRGRTRKESANRQRDQRRERRAARAAAGELTNRQSG